MPLPDVNEPGRQPVQIVELDQPRCALTYGEAPCTAALGTTGEHRCYNTFATCQAQGAYQLGAPLTLRFRRPEAPASGEYELPLLVSATASGARLNVGAKAGRDGPLGRRGGLSVVFSDAPHSDVQVDPYRGLRGWNALERGTFWSKWLRRNPYHYGLSIRLREGYAGQAPEEMPARHYVIDRFRGPDGAGRVEISAVDVLRLADEERALAPVPSRGVLISAVDAGATSIYLRHAEDYPMGSTVRIGDELLRLEFMLATPHWVRVVRGVAGTLPAAHAADAPVQAVLAYRQARVDEVLADLLTTYARIPQTAIPAAEWAAEVGAYLPHATVTRSITTPTGVLNLVGELAEQCGVYLWWDDATRTIQLRTVNRPAEEDLVLTEDRDILQNTLTITAQPEERATEVWVHYGLKAGEDPSRRQSYTGVAVAVDPDSRRTYRDRRMHEVLGSWLDNLEHATALAAALLQRLRRTPNYASFALDARRAPAMSLGMRFYMQHRTLVDMTGAMVLRDYQVVALTRQGDRLLVEARPYYGLGQPVIT